MQATIARIYTTEKYEGDHAKKMRVGDVWNDDDFKMLSLVADCLPLDVAPDDEIKQRTAHIFQAWLDDWEEVHTGAHGDAVLEQMILRKYGGL